MELMVEVRTLAGDQLPITLLPEATVADVKCAVAVEWSIPVVCQKLTFVDSDLKDDETLSALLSDRNDSLALLLTITLAALRLDLEGSHDGKKRQALETLGHLGYRGGEASIVAVCGCFEDADETVRLHAVETLRLVAAKGDEVALAEVHGRIAHKKPHVREAAVRAMALLSRRGDELATRSLADCVADSNKFVRSAAVLALSKIAESGDAAALEAITGRFCDDDELVRWSAQEALSILQDAST
eukprot:TRINITY_DN65695_c0_g1_i1.p2 TRINITY_DN65695_c0_g1~~TRINITY_DN65695_c0_g1_i1.p2  ORF type:complete len:257 (+),score=54.10 TRINITY_DN65695_c0_g1_i1:40-771(+)